MKKILAVILSFMFLLGCSRSDPTGARLEELGSAIEERPDSVLDALRALPADSVTGDRNRALYALLMSHALYKNYIDVTDDSLAMVAADYFADGDEPRYEMLSQFCLGRVRFNAEDFSGSLLAMFKAFDIARQLDDPLWTAMTAREIGETYITAFNATESIAYYKLALDKFIESGNSRFFDSSLYYYVKALNNCKKYDSCFIVADAVLDLDGPGYNGHHVKSPEWRHEVNQAVGISLYGLHRYAEAADQFKSVATSKCGTFSDSAWYALSYILSGDADLGRVAPIVRRADNDSDLLVCELKHQYYLANGSYALALKYCELGNDHVGDEIVSHVYQDLSTSVIRQYDSEKNEKQAIIERNRLITVVVILVLVIIAGLVIACILHRLKRQRETLLNNMEIVEDLRQTLSLRDSEIVDTQNAVRELLAGHYRYFDELCQIYYENSEVNSAKKISDELSRFIEDITSEQNIAKLETLINSHHSDILVKLRNDIPRLSNDDYLLFMFTILGFSSNAIALFLKVDKITSVYDRRKYLKQRIKKLDETKQALYMAVFKPAVK